MTYLSTSVRRPVVSSPLRCKEIGSVLVITLARPQLKNAINREMAESLADAFDRLDADDSLKIGVLTGEGPDFCAGMDLKAFADGVMPETRERGLAGLTRVPPRKPLIAAVEGHAVAGGFELVLSCDLVIASETARFGLPEVKRGLIAAGGGIVRLAQMVPRNLAAHLLLTGDTIPVGEAKEIGVVNSISSAGMALDDAIPRRHLACISGPDLRGGRQRACLGRRAEGHISVEGEGHPSGSSRSARSSGHRQARCVRRRRLSRVPRRQGGPVVDRLRRERSARATRCAPQVGKHRRKGRDRPAQTPTPPPAVENRPVRA
ncbi:Enoyl-CoA hydratase/isomerase [Rhodococcus rhodochrous ATCC 21198]|nr:Enoyl-CoA hydratase/isomerase [Rhodococcus rhodochrous ATCC 21198]